MANSKPKPSASKAKGGAKPAPKGGARKAKDQAKAPPPAEEKKRLGAPTEYETAEDLQKAIDEYFEGCKPEPLMVEIDGRPTVATDAKGKPIIVQNPPTIAGLAYDLGYASRQSIYDLEQRSDAFSYVIKRARLLIEAHHEANLSTRDKPVGDIFWMKNHGWKDKTELEMSGDLPPMIVNRPAGAANES